jgi:hypothetical protein
MKVVSDKVCHIVRLGGNGCVKKTRQESPVLRKPKDIMKTSYGRGFLISHERDEGTPVGFHHD